MIFAFVVLLILVALSIDVLWTLAFFCAVAAMNWTASLHLSDPLAPLYAFFLGCLGARLVLELIRHLIAHGMD